MPAYAGIFFPARPAEMIAFAQMESLNNGLFRHFATRKDSICCRAINQLLSHKWIFKDF